LSGEEPLREPCFHCGEPAALAARLCPRCSRSLLVDVRLQKQLQDGRVLYGLSRALSRLGPGALSLPELRASGPRPLVCRGVTREYAKKALEVCASFGVSGEFEPHRPPSMLLPSSLLKRPLLAGAAILLPTLLGLSIFLLSRGRSGTSPATEGFVLTTAQIAAASGPSTVSLTCGSQIGSGFFLTADRLVTNAHVVCKDDGAVSVHFASGRELKGSVVSRDEKLDLALVEVKDAGATPLAIGDAALLSPGDKVVIIGTPLGMDQTVLEGIVSHVGRNLFGVAYVQLDANVNPGNSGGPVLNERGQIVGVVTLKADDASGMGFALPINYVHAGKPPLLALEAHVSPAWERLLAQVKEAEAKDRGRAATVFTRPALVAAKMPPNAREVVVVILKRWPVHPARERLEVAFEREGKGLCRSYIDVREWLSLDEVTGQMQGDLPADVRWLQEYDQGDQLWYGPGFMGANDCSDVDLATTEAVLQDAEPGYERVDVGR
jgi:serine protease Do